MEDEIVTASKVDPEEVARFEKEVDEPPLAKEATEADPYEGMATPKEAEETMNSMAGRS